MPVSHDDVAAYWAEILPEWDAQAGRIRPKLSKQKRLALKIDAYKRMFTHAPFVDDVSELRARAFSVFIGGVYAKG